MNPAVKAGCLVAGMAAGADSIDDLDLLWHGAMSRLFGGIRAPSTLGSHLRSCTWGHVAQLEKVSRVFLAELARQAPLLPGADTLAFVDIDSTQKRVYGYRKQGARFGYTKIAGKEVTVRGLNALAAAISTPLAAPVIAATRLRGGNAAAVRGAAGFAAAAVRTPGPAGARGWSWSGWTRRITPLRCCTRSAGPAPGSRSPSRAIHRSAPRSPPSRKMPGHPSATRGRSSMSNWAAGCRRPRSPRCLTRRSPASLPAGGARGRTAIDGRLMTRRVQDQNTAGQDGLFPVWRHHAVFTDSPFATLQAEGQHRDHAIIEQVFADCYDGPLAHLPSVL